MAEANPIPAGLPGIFQEFGENGLTMEEKAQIFSKLYDKITCSDEWEAYERQAHIADQGSATAEAKTTETSAVPSMVFWRELLREVEGMDKDASTN